jgi:hypothetical protein
VLDIADIVRDRDFSTSAIPAAEYPVQFPVIGDGCETHEIRYRRLSCHG